MTVTLANIFRISEPVQIYDQWEELGAKVLETREEELRRKTITLPNVFRVSELVRS